MAYSISGYSIGIGPFQFFSGIATGDNDGDDSIEIKAIGGNVAYSLDGGQNFSTNWNGVTIPVGNDTLVFSSITINVGDAGQWTPGVSHSVKIDTSNGALQSTSVNVQNRSQDGDTSKLDIDDSGTTTTREYTLDGLSIMSTGINVTLNGATFSQGVTLSGGNTGPANTFTYNPSSLRSGLTGQPIKLVGGPAADLFRVTYVPVSSGGVDATLTLDGNGGADTVNLGTGGNAVDAINSPVLLRNSSPSGSLALTFDDSGDSTAQSFVLTSTGFGLSGGPAKVDFTGQALRSFVIKEGSAGNTNSVSSTPSNAAIQGGLPITISTVAGSNNTIVTGTGADASLSVDGGGGADSVTIGQGDTSSILGAIAVSNPGGTIALIVDDSAGTQSRIVDLDAASLTGLTGGTVRFSDLASLVISEGRGGNTTIVSGVPAGIATTLNTGAGEDDTTIEAVGSGSTLVIDGQGGVDSVTLGSSGLVAGIAGGVTVANTGGATDLLIDDSADPSPLGNVLVSSVTVGQQDLIRLSGLPSAALDAIAADLLSLTVKLGPTGGGVGNSVTYDVSTGSFTANLFTGAQDDVVQVKATAPGSDVSIVGQGGSNTATLGNGGLSTLFGTISLWNFASTVVDASADQTGRDYLLSVLQGATILSGLPNGTTVRFGMPGSVQLIAGAGDDMLTVDLADGDPITPGGVTFDGGVGDNSLSLLNGSVDDEVYTPSASQPGSGKIALTTGAATSTLTFSGLKPIIDTVAAINYVVDLTLVTGPLAVNITSVGDATRIASADSPSAFEMTDVANKQHITVSTGSGDDSIYVNLTTANAALLTLRVNTDGGSDRVDVVATPAGVGTFINTQAADDNVRVLGAGLGGTLIVDGGTGLDTLDIDAGGSAITPPVGSPLTILGHAVTYTNVGFVNVAGAAAASPTIAFQDAGLSLNAVQRTSFANQLVARFTATTPGVPKSAYIAASIDWGDGTTSAGLVVPSSTSTVGGVTVTTYDVLGSHTYGAAGTSYTISTTLATTAADFVTTAGGVKVTTGLLGETAGPASIPVTVVPAGGGGSVVNVSVALDPASDSGRSNSDYITNVVQPRFFGLTQAGVTVRLFVKASGASGLGTLIGTTASDAAGAWSVTSHAALNSGSYTITAVATAENGTTANAEPPSPLVIDTISPVITGVVVNRIGRTIQVVFVDALSGLDQSSLADGRSYVLTGRDIARRRPLPPSSLVSTVLSISAATTTTSPQTVKITYGRGQTFLPASYLLQVLSGGITDVSGNRLAGTYYGSYPTGNGRPGDFNAAFSIGRGRVTPLRPLVSYVAPPRGLTASASRPLPASNARVATRMIAGPMSTGYQLLTRKPSLPKP